MTGLGFGGAAAVGTAGTIAANNGDKIVTATQQVTQTATKFTTNSYNVSELFKTQPDSITRVTGASVEAIKSTMLEQGAHTIEPIKVFVREVAYK